MHLSDLSNMSTIGQRHLVLTGDRTNWTRIHVQIYTSIFTYYRKEIDHYNVYGRDISHILNGVKMSNKNVSCY